ncbi:MAG TPA: AAA family ATPase [Bacillota bacterium]|nr:AAA family ATPase [Bacillota bacterium]
MHRRPLRRPALGTGLRDVSPAQPTPSPLWERDGERQRLDAALAGARDGRGAVLLLRGDPGLGKTRLLAVAAAAAADRFTLVSVAGQEQEQAYPFALLHQVVESVVRQPGTGAAELTRGLEVLRGWFYGPAATENPPAGRGPGARAALLYAAYWLLASVAEARPLLVCLDDMHWSDPDSLEAVRFLAHRLGRLPVALVGGLRAWPAAASEIAEALAQDGLAELRDLRPLSATAGEQLLGQVLGASPSRDQADLARDLAGGNPLLIEQLARVWRTAPTAAPRGDGAATPRRWPLLARLSGLPAATSRLLEAASVVGLTFRLEETLAVAGMEPATAETALEPARALGVLVPAGGERWAFVHPLFRQALYEDLSEARRGALHRGALEWLRRRGAPASELAPHVLQAAIPGDLRALRDLRNAAEEAESVGASESAALRWSEALALCRRSDPGRADLQYRLGLAHQRAGRQQAAAVAFAAALGAADTDHGLRARIHAAWALSCTFIGDATGARANLGAAVDEASGHSPELTAEMCVTQAVLLHSFGGLPEAVTSVERGEELARATGDPALLARAKACRAWVSWGAGEPETYRWAREAAVQMPPGPPDDLELTIGWSVSMAHGVVALLWGRYDEARVALEETNALARTRHSMSSLIWTETFLTDLAWRRGDLHAAFAHAEAIPADGIGLPWMTAEPRLHRGRVLMDMGDLDGAAACFTLADAEARAAGEAPVRMLAAFAQAALAGRRGRWGEAAGSFANAAEMAAAFMHASLDPFRWTQEGIEALLHTGRLDQAAPLIDGMQSSAQRMGWQGDEAIALRCRAMLAAAQGRAADAEACFAAAVALHRQVGETLEEGRTLLAHGAWLRRQGDPLRARRVLDEASVRLDGSGAGYWVSLAEAERRSAGGRRRHRLTTGPLARLTPQEYRVAELVSRGLSNREIACTLLVSPKTLETHLGHIYEKLALESRGALKEYFARHVPGRSAAGPGQGAT